MGYTSIRKISVFGIIVSALFIIVLFLGLNTSLWAQDTTVTFSPTYNLPEKVIIGDDHDFPPYSFFDKNGQPSGFNIAIAKRVAELMGIEVEFRLGEWSSIRKALEDGEIDAVSGMFYSSERSERYSFTTRHSLSNGDIFTRQGFHVRSLTDLKGKTVVVQRGDIVAEYLFHQNLDLNLVEVESVQEVLRLVQDGTYDYAGVLKLPGLFSVKENDFYLLINQGLTFMSNDYSMAVKKGNEDLLYILNAGLYALKASDEYYHIHNEWLGFYEDKGFWDLVSTYKWLLIFVASFVGGLIFVSITLKYLVNKKTRELQSLYLNLNSAHNELIDKNKLLAESQKTLEEQLLKINKQGEIIRFKQNFLANMSHEIRTPLNGIIGMGNILSQTALDNDQREYISILKQSGENLMEIINQVLDFSKIESGKMQLNKSSFVLADLDKSAHILFKSICHKEIDFSSSIDPQLPKYIHADKGRITQIINNLLSNAVKFTHEGEIKIWFLLDNETDDKLTLKVIVTDTGMGIQEEQQAKLFRPFSRIHESEYREIEGTGLGLSICRELAVMHGGATGLESTYGKGSKFWFTFVAQKVKEELAAVLESDQNPSFLKEADLRILLVEDKVVNQKVISLILSSAGHKLKIVENGLEALKAFDPDLFDLVLMDIQMPVMDGVTATKRLREMHPILPPIIGLSANAFEGDREKYMSMGMDEYITKPFQKEAFDAALKRFSLKSGTTPLS